MVLRRDFLKYGLAASSVAAARQAHANKDKEWTQEELLNFLCPPDNFPAELATPSPPVKAFTTKLFIPPLMEPVPELNPPPNPDAHQRYEDFKPKKFYEIHEQEFRWAYHEDAPYTKPGRGGSVSWGFNGVTPGPIYHAHYGEPVLVRLFNDLPPIGQSKATFALPSTTTHLHNAHTASESDGQPQDWIDSGEFWDHHYGNFPAGNDPREKLTTLWYHDHRLDFTAANVYAGLSGFYFLFDPKGGGGDTGDENDPDPKAWRLPSGEFDVPLMLHDVLFNEEGEVVFNNFNTAGILGDQFTVNRKIRPYHEVKRRKYRIRIINGGPSRFYRLYMVRESKPDEFIPFTILTGDGNFLPRPVKAESIYLSVAQRVDIVVDFTDFEPGEKVSIINLLEQIHGQGPSGRLLSPDPADRDFTGVVQFHVGSETPEDPSRVPDKFREVPPIRLADIKQERTWVFDYDGGLWTINGKVMDPNRIDAGIEQGSAEIWTFRNGGNNWSHPIHSHFVEFLLLEVNGRAYKPTFLRSRHNQEDQFIEYFGADDKEKDRVIEVFMGGPRRDVATLLPNDEIVLYMRWPDFLGKYVMHCHNVVHEDHAMMIRWDIVEPGKGFLGSRTEQEVYGGEEPPVFLQEHPNNATIGGGEEEEDEE